MLDKLKVLAVREMDNLFWQTKEEFIWWKGDLSLKERIIRMAKQLDAFVLDLLFPKLNDDQT